MKAGKIWGDTFEVFSNAAFELHRIEVRGGASCSQHRHAHKWNGFHVERGGLEIIIWRESGTVDRVLLNPGETCIVPPGEFHQFRAVSQTVAYEFYWAAPLQAGDIDRRTIGHA